MQKILRTTQLEYEKSNFLIDVVKHDSGKLYVEITQTIQQQDKTAVQSTVKLNPVVVDDLIEVLKLYQSLIIDKGFIKGDHLSTEKQKEIQNRYLKGIPLRDLSLQFDISEMLITQILMNKGIKIVEENIKLPPKRSLRKRRY